MTEIETLKTNAVSNVEANQGEIQGNQEVVNTSKMALSIAKTLNKRLYLSRFLGFLVKILSVVNVSAKKAFGSLFYEIESKYFVDDLISFEDSMRESV